MDMEPSATRTNPAATSGARFSALFEHHHLEVLAYCMRRVDRSTAEDAASEVFTVAWRRIDELEWESARPWLYGIARGVLWNQQSSSRRWINLNRRTASLAPEVNAGPEVIVLQSESAREVSAALNRMSEADREILLLSVWEELTGPEIATALGIATNAVDQRLFRAKKRFAKYLKDSPTHSPSAPHADTEGGGR